MATEWYQYTRPDGKKAFGFINSEEWIAMKAFHKKIENRMFRIMMFGNMKLHLERIAKREAQYPTCHYAYVFIGKKHVMAWVTKDEKQAFKMDGYENSYIPYKSFTFDRWCTSFDL